MTLLIFRSFRLKQFTRETKDDLYKIEVSKKKLKMLFSDIKLITLHCKMNDHPFVKNLTFVLKG